MVNYDLLLKQAAALMEGQEHLIPNLANLADRKSVV